MKSTKYWVLAGIKDHIYNARQGVDMCDYAFGILYKDGSILEVVGNDLPEGRIIIGESKVSYCWESSPDDAADSLGRSWTHDFLKDMDPADPDAYLTVSAWNEYVESNMRKE